MEHYGMIYPQILNTHALSTDINVFFQDFSMDMLEDKEVAGHPEILKKPDLDALRAILGVTYEEVSYTPINLNGFASGPYVKARMGTEWVDSHSMSHGELCVHLIRWTIKQASGNIVLLDEPESNIAPRGHAALLDEIARMARTSGVQVVLATHSAAFLSRVPLSWVRMCVRPNRAPQVMIPSRASDLRDSLGIENPLR
ncbi:AAA family ATPase, partial [Streptomyces sp. NPDC048279]|uniref:AAA family ATPase n=1 Tax=Streptomyces sp. NPDC048279 TaxID=3154714 RepID=UPI0034445C66